VARALVPERGPGRRRLGRFDGHVAQMPLKLK
jgi:hypothetical protein